MKRIFFAILALLAFSSPSAFAQSSISSDFDTGAGSSGYLRLGLGAGLTNASAPSVDDTGYWGFGMDAAVGVTFAERVRWDVLMVGYSRFDALGTLEGIPVSFTGSRLDLQTAVWIGDFSRTRRLHPYIGASIGSARYSEFDDVYWGFAWGAGAGFEYQVTSHLAIGPRYMFRQALLEYTVGPNTHGFNLNTHELTVSIVWNGD